MNSYDVTALAVKEDAGSHTGNSQNEILPSNNSTNTATGQRNIVLAYLLAHGSITTLQARNELYIMGIAARIWELKHEQGHSIITRIVPASFGGKRKIAKYVLLPNVAPL